MSQQSNHRERGGASRVHSRSPYVAERQKDSSCTHICSRRGIVLLVSVLTNTLVLICLVAAHVVTSGMTTSVASFDINSIMNLQGTELQKARDLDMHYSQLRAPALYGGIPFSLTAGVVSLLLVVAGNRPPHLTSHRLLLGALVYQAVGAGLYVVAVALYLHFIKQVNATDVCEQRARLYMRSGYTWMNCSVGGGDAAVALFGLITAILYAVGAGLTARVLRAVRRYRQQRVERSADSPMPMAAEPIYI